MIRLTLVGGRASERTLAVQSLGDDVELGPEFAPIADLRRLIERSHLVAGIFGTSRKAASIVPFKVVHALAQGRPVLTADTPCARAMLDPGRDCLVCPAGDAHALAERLRWAAAHRDELSEVAGRARARYDSTFSLAAAGVRFVEVLGRRFGAEPAAPIPSIPEPVDAAR